MDRTRSDLRGHSAAISSYFFLEIGNSLATVNCRSKPSSVKWPGTLGGLQKGSGVLNRVGRGWLNLPRPISCAERGFQV